MKYFSMFSGIGGFELGIQRAFDMQPKDAELQMESDKRGDNSNSVQRAASCIGYSEIDRYAIKVYERQFGEDRLCGKQQEERFPSVQPERNSTSTTSEVGHAQTDKHRGHERQFNGKDSRVARERECDCSPQGGQETLNSERGGLPQIDGDMHHNSDCSYTKSDTNGGHKNYGDATTINATELPDFDLLVGGFPCQAFSVAGKRRGLDDARGTLFYDIARILKVKKPKHFVLENVKGLLSSRTTLTFDAISDTLNTECVVNIKQNKHIPISEWQPLTDNLSVYLQSIGGISGLSKNFRHLQTRILQTIKKQNFFLTEKMRLSGLNVEEWVSVHEKLYFTESLSSLDTPTLEKMVVMNGDVVSLLKKASEENLDQKKLSTTSTERSLTTDQKTFMSVLIEMNITSFIMKQYISSSTLWNKIKSNSRKENTYYVKTFNLIISELEKLRYSVEWQIVNSKDFGVPQNRERVYIVGHLGNECGRKVFPIIGKRGKNIRKIVDTGHDGTNIFSIEGSAVTQKALGGGQGGKGGLYAIPVLTPDRLEKRQNGRRMKTDGEPAFTVTSQDRHGIYNGARIRRLTPLECERLQGFPDNWTKYGEDEHGMRVDISDSQRYKMCGNAVTVNTVQAVMEKIFND